MVTTRRSFDEWLALIEERACKECVKAHARAHYRRKKEQRFTA